MAQSKEVIRTARRQNVAGRAPGGAGRDRQEHDCRARGSGIILVDAGMAFPDEEMPGIDLVLPDFTYLREHSDEIRGIVLTHGHEDHVGRSPYVLREFNVPVYATRLTLGLVRSKLQEFGIKNADLREVKAGQKTQLGGFGLEFIGVNHSIPTPSPSRSAPARD